MKYAHILSAIQDTLWAIHPAKMDAILGVIDARSRGITIDATLQQMLREERESRAAIRNGMAILGVHGTLSKRVGLLTGSGGTSVDQLTGQFKAAMQDDSVERIVLDVDSPGGSVFGLTEAAAEMRKYKGKKPVTAVVNPESYSAAYYLTSQADEIVITPSGMAGSIGVLYTHIDETALNEELGIKVTYIQAGKYKTEGFPDVPLSEEARDEIQKRVDTYYAMFLNDVATGRGVSVDTVESQFGQGRVFNAEEAVSRGLADRIGTLDDVVAEHQQKRAMSRRRMRAAVARQKVGA